MMPKVSILVPVYNVSSYIERCARSLFEQSYRDIEYIFVDDASTDNSVDILQKVLTDYPLRAENVKIIRNDKNEGVGFTRNIAVDNALGAYILFVDSDDYIELNTVEELVQFAHAENADIVCFDMEIEYPDRRDIVSDYISDNHELNFRNIISEKLSHNLCNKFVKTELYKADDCRIPNGLNYQEDFYVCVRLIFYARKISKINKVYYHYDYSNSGSITKRMGKMHFANTVLLWNSIHQFLRDQGLFEKYKYDLDFPKIYRKIRLMIDTKDFKLRKTYAGIFSEEEKRVSKQFSKGEQRFLFLLRHRLFISFLILQKALILKTGIVKSINNKLH